MSKGEPFQRKTVTALFATCAVLSGCFGDNLRTLETPQAINYCKSKHKASNELSACVDDYFQQRELERQRNKADIAACEKQFGDSNKVWWCSQNRREVRWTKEGTPPDPY